MDLNEDGQTDILSGSYSRNERPMAGLFQVLWGSEDGFRKAETLHGTDGEPLIIPADDEQEVTRKICTRPTATDWDGDGDLDLLVGNFEGTFFLFEGEGAGKFKPQPVLLKRDGQPLRVSGAHSDPFVVDWDGDGDLDILSGTAQGGVEWAENRAGKGEKPDLGYFESLVAASGHGVVGKDGPSDSTRVWAEDMNGDGKLDLLVGDNAIINHPAEGLTREEMLRKLATWEKELAALMEEMNEAPVTEDRVPPENLMNKFRKHQEAKSEFLTEERTGYVWLFVQK